jgi:hypothetical protein
VKESAYIVGLEPLISRFNETVKLGCRVRQPMNDFDLRVPHPCALQGCGFFILDSLFPLADCGPSFHRARRVSRGRKTRTLHKSGEGCGTRKVTHLYYLAHPPH